MSSRKREREPEAESVSESLSHPHENSEREGEEKPQEPQQEEPKKGSGKIASPKTNLPQRHPHRVPDSAPDSQSGRTNSSSVHSVATDERPVPFSILIWNEVSTVLFARIAERLRTCLLAIIRSFETTPASASEKESVSPPQPAARRVSLLHQLHQDLRLTWEAGKSLYLFSSAAADVDRYDARVRTGVQQMVHQLVQITTAQEDPLTLCRQYIRLTEEHGLGEEDSGELGACLSSLKFKLYPNGYAYSERVPVVVAPPPVVESASPTASPTWSESSVSAAGTTVIQLGSDPSSPPAPPPTRRDGGSKRGGGGPSGPSSTSPAPASPAATQPAAGGRRGYVIAWQQDCPNLSPLLNTTIQLMEPRKRRPPLDEYRIFSHPKKTATHGVEDIIVDEELYYRSLCLLIHHLDTFGSLHGLSPFARFCLYNVVERVDKNFFAVCDRACTSHDVYQHLLQLRDTLEAKKESLEKTRASLREAAQQIGWFAVSAQWRDQVLGTLQDVEENDWYYLSDTLRTAGISRFPNYITSYHVKTFTLKVLEKLTSSPVSTAALLATSGIHQLNGIEDPLPGPKVMSIVRYLLFPLLEGGRLPWPLPPSASVIEPESTAQPSPEQPVRNTPSDDASGSRVTNRGSDKAGEGEEAELRWKARRARVQRKLRHLYLKWSIACKEVASQSPLGEEGEREAHAREIIRGSAAVTPHSAVMQANPDLSSTTLIIPSLVFPVQCLGELLEVCSAALTARDGIAAFATSFLAAEWSCGNVTGRPSNPEEAILRHLLREAPTNISIASLVAIPKVYRDLLAGLQVLLADMTALHLVVEAKNVMMDMEGNTVPHLASKGHSSAAMTSTTTVSSNSPLPAPSLPSRSSVVSRCCRPQDRLYVYWKMLSVFLEEEEERLDELVFLTVSRNTVGVGNVATGSTPVGGWGFSPSCFPTAASSQEDLEALEESVPCRFYSEGAMERATRVWPQEMVALLLEEEKHRVKK